jgi:outer membrane lipoprotein SlyB
VGRNLITILMAAIVCLGLVLVTGCESRAQNGALIGTGVGAAAGQVIGRDTKSTVIGGAIGAGAGYIIGNETDKKK